MDEIIPNSENNAERILNEREVLNEFDRIIDGEYEIFRTVEDESGLLVLEVRTTDEDGDIVQYDYHRKSPNLNKQFSSDTRIDVTYYMGNIPVSGRCVQRYIEGVWVPEID